MRTRSNKPRLQPSLRPHNCVTLNVDCAESSGWSIWACGRLVAFGEVNMLASPEAGRSAVEYALELADELGVKAALVFERPFRGTSQGQWIGSWKQRWVSAGGVKSRMLGVYPATWRTRVLGRGWGAAKRERVRDKEQEVAVGFARQFKLDEGLARHGDVAPAILIGKWSMHAGEVLARVDAGEVLARVEPRAVQTADALMGVFGMKRVARKARSSRNA